MVQFPRAASNKNPANRSYERLGEDVDESVKKDLYTRWHRNTIQRDLIDAGCELLPSLCCALLRAPSLCPLLLLRPSCSVLPPDAECRGRRRFRGLGHRRGGHGLRGDRPPRVGWRRSSTTEQRRRPNARRYG